MICGYPVCEICFCFGFGVRTGLLVFWLSWDLGLDFGFYVLDFWIWIYDFMDFGFPDFGLDFGFGFGFWILDFPLV